MENSTLFVEFYTKSVKNNFKSEKEGHDVMEDRDYVKILIPGDDKTIINTLVNDKHKERFPREWEIFQLRKKNKEYEINSGTPLSVMIQSEAQQRELNFIHIHTVEQLANISDAQCQRIPMGGTGLREQARRYLESERDSFANDRIKALEDQIAALTAAQQKKPGRPAKAEA